MSVFFYDPSKNNTMKVKCVQNTDEMPTSTRRTWRGVDAIGGSGPWEGIPTVN